MAWQQLNWPLILLTFILLQRGWTLPVAYFYLRILFLDQSIQSTPWLLQCYRKSQSGYWHVASLTAAHSAKPPHVGWAKEWGDLQWPPGFLWQLDEHQPERGQCWSVPLLLHPLIFFGTGDLHKQGWRQVLEDAWVLHKGLKHQVPQVKWILWSNFTWNMCLGSLMRW